MQSELSHLPDQGMVQEMTERQMREKTENYIINLQDTIEVQQNILGVIDACDDAEDRVMAAEQYGITDVDAVRNALDENVATVILLQDTLTQPGTARTAGHGTYAYDAWRDTTTDNTDNTDNTVHVPIPEDIKVLAEEIEKYCEGRAYNVKEELFDILNDLPANYAQGALSGALDMRCQFVRQKFVPITKGLYDDVVERVELHKTFSITLGFIIITSMRSNEHAAFERLSKCRRRAIFWMFKFANLPGSLMYQRTIEWVNAHIQAITRGVHSSKSLEWKNRYEDYVKRSPYYNYQRVPYYKDISDDAKGFMKLIFGASLEFESMRYPWYTLENIMLGLTQTRKDSDVSDGSDANTLSALTCIILSTSTTDVSDLHDLALITIRWLFTWIDIVGESRVQPYIDSISTKEMHADTLKGFIEISDEMGRRKFDEDLIAESAREYCGMYADAVSKFVISIANSAIAKSKPISAVIRDAYGYDEEQLGGRKRRAIALGYLIINVIEKRDTHRTFAILSEGFDAMMAALMRLAAKSSWIKYEKVVEWVNMHIMRITRSLRDSGDSGDADSALIHKWHTERTCLLESDSYFHIASFSVYKELGPHAKDVVNRILRCPTADAEHIKCLRCAFAWFMNNRKPEHTDGVLLSAFECIIQTTTHTALRHRVIDEIMPVYFETLCELKTAAYLDQLEHVKEAIRDDVIREKWKMWISRFLDTVF
jgi:hypothetical protein